jgi:dihydroorotate dehydrogenase electron transfer subunit
MKKHILDLKVKSVERVHERYVLIRLTDEQPLPEMLPGQFVEVRVDGSPSTFLRRPISIHFVDRAANELWLLVACVGDGTRRLAQLAAGDTLNCVLPLGNGFSLNSCCGLLRADDQRSGALLTSHPSPLLVGGGVGVAPLLYLGAVLRQGGADPTFLLGARTAKDLLMLAEFEKYGRVLVTTEDGSMGEKGFVTNHSVLQQAHFDLIQCCGPTPMMKAVARYAVEMNIDCEVSLENLMACGLGACLCCVEKVKAAPSAGGEAATTNVCVCKDGPVFNIKRLLWQS